MSEKDDSPTDASGTEKKTADRGSEVPGRPLENKQGFGEESTMSTQEKENDGIANPSSHQDLEVKPPLTTIKTGMISSFYNVKISFYMYWWAGLFVMFILLNIGAGRHRRIGAQTEKNINRTTPAAVSQTVTTAVSNYYSFFYDFYFLLF